MSLARIEVSTAAVLANVAEHLAHDGAPLAVDLGRDAWGHGAVGALPVLAQAGVSLVTAASRDERAHLDALIRDQGLPLQVVSPDDPVAEAAWPNAALAFGLTGFTDSVISVYATVVRVKTVAAGEGVSYGHTFVTKRKTALALIGIGYADGIDRRAGNRVHIGIGRRSVPLVGRVAMNVAVAALGSPWSRLARSVKEGDEVLVFGGAGQRRRSVAARATAIEWAFQLDIEVCEVTVRLAERIPRRWVP